MPAELTSGNERKSFLAKALKRLAAPALAAIFIFLACRGCNFAQIWTIARQSQAGYLFLLCLSVIISHILRARRWLILLQPVSSHRLSLWNSFCAVIIGYTVNLVIPRGGEVARLVSICKSEKLSWAAVLPTMFIDRFFDVVALVLVFSLSLPLLPKTLLNTMPWLAPGACGLMLVSIVVLLLLPKMATIMRFATHRTALQKLLSPAVIDLVEGLAEKFQTGTKSLTSVSVYPAFLTLTAAMWFFYWLNFYLVVLAMNLQARVSPQTCLVVFSLGNVGVLVPSPGAVGSFHFFVSQALMYTAGLGKDQALAYATVLHIFCFVVACVLPAGVCVFVQSRQKSADN